MIKSIDYEKYKSKATIRLDTTDIDVANLRKTLFKRYRDEEKAPVILTFVSFGYKHGIPRDADMIFDVRSIPNPYYDEKLRNLTGEDEEVIEFLIKHKETEEYQKLICDFLDKYINDSLKENRALINVAIGVQADNIEASTLQAILQIITQVKFKHL